MDANTGNIALEIRSLGKSFNTASGKNIVIDRLDITVSEGEFISLVGHSGCGKSTVLSMIAGLTAIDKGEILLYGKTTKKAGLDRGVVFQNSNLLPWTSSLGNVMFAVNQVSPGLSSRERKEISRSCLQKVGIDGDEISKMPGQLSQGMKQRVGIARAFATNPRLLLLDEPFGSMDSITRIELHDTLTEMLLASPKTTLLITHDIEEAIYLSDRIYVMTKGPSAKIDKIVTVPFSRPRDRDAIVAKVEYEELLKYVLQLLNNQ